MTTLLVGGAGYIGSHMVKRLIEDGEPLVVLDNLSSGYPDAILGGHFIEGDCGSPDTVRDIVKRFKPDTVMHFASFIQVGESVNHPAKYYINNVVNTIGLLSAMVENGVKNFVFSSSAAVYGDAGADPIREGQLCAPVSPYGRTKRMIEEVLQDFSQAYGLNYFALRYFNAAGATQRQGSANGTIRRRTSYLSYCRRHPAGARPLPCSAAITRRRMAPAFAIMFTWKICARRISLRCAPCGAEKKAGLSISAPHPGLAWPKC